MPIESTSPQQWFQSRLIEDGLPVTVKWLSRQCGVNSAEARKELKRFLENHADQCHAFYYLSGLTESLGMLVSIVKEEALQKAKNNLKTVYSCSLIAIHSRDVLDYSTFYNCDADPKNKYLDHDISHSRFVYGDDLKRPPLRVIGSLSASKENGINGEAKAESKISSPKKCNGKAAVKVEPKETTFTAVKEVPKKEKPSPKKFFTAVGKKKDQLKPKQELHDCTDASSSEVEQKTPKAEPPVSENDCSNDSQDAEVFVHRSRSQRSKTGRAHEDVNDVITLNNDIFSATSSPECSPKKRAQKSLTEVNGGVTTLPAPSKRSSGRDRSSGQLKRKIIQSDSDQEEDTPVGEPSGEESDNVDEVEEKIKGGRRKKKSGSQKQPSDGESSGKTQKSRSKKRRVVSSSDEEDTEDVPAGKKNGDISSSGPTKTRNSKKKNHKRETGASSIDGIFGVKADGRSTSCEKAKNSGQNDNLDGDIASLSSDEIIPPTPETAIDKISGGNKRFKRGKNVSKTFTDEDGYEVTKTVWVEEEVGCDDTAKDTEAGSVTDSPGRRSARLGSKSPEKKVVQEKSSQKKSSKPSATVKNQASLMSFFKKN